MVELEPHLEGARLEAELGLPEGGLVELHDLPFGGGDDTGATEKAGILEFVDLAIAGRDRDVVPIANLLDGSGTLVGCDENPFRIIVREETRNILLPYRGGVGKVDLNLLPPSYQA